MQQLDIVGAMRWCGSRYHDKYDEARAEFAEACDIDYDAFKDPDEARFVDLLFSEWFLFDYQPTPGQTPVDTLCRETLGQSDLRMLNNFRQVMKTQRCGVYWILGINPAEDIVFLENVLNGQAEKVWAPSIVEAEGFSQGYVALRLADINGETVMPGSTVFGRAGKVDKEAKKAFKKSVQDMDLSFTELVAMRFGREALAARSEE